MSKPKSVADLLDLLVRPRETDAIDFKLRIENTAGGRAEFIKDILAFANSGGGVLFIGVKGTEYIGIEPEDERIYDAANLHQWLKDRISPIPVITSERLEYRGRVFFAVTVQTEQKAVFLPTKDLVDERNVMIGKAGTIYIRQNTRSEAAVSDQAIRKVLDSVVAHKVDSEVKVRIATVQQFVSQSTAEAPKVETNTVSLVDLATRHVGFNANSGHWDIRIVPANGRRLSPPEVKDLFGFSFDKDGDNFPFLGINNGFCQVRRLSTGFAAFSKVKTHWIEVSHFGFDSTFTSVASLLEDFLSEDQGTVSLRNKIIVEATVRKISLCCYYACALIEKKLLDGDLRIQIRLKNIAGRQLHLGTGMGLWQPRTSLENEILVECTLSIDTLTQIRDTATRMSADLFAHFDWAPASSSSIIFPMVDSHINHSNKFQTDFWFKV